MLCTAGGAIFGDLPPYEAFPIGGTNSVRGYSEGGVGTGRNYAVASAELHCPLPIKPLEVSIWISEHRPCTASSFDIKIMHAYVSCRSIHLRRVS